MLDNRVSGINPIICIMNRKPTLMMPTFSVFFRYSQNIPKFDPSKNYYQLLDLSYDSSKAAIRNSYLNLAKRYHPDINPKGKDKFTLIQEAYQVLSNDSSKKLYDAFYMEFIKTTYKQKQKQPHSMPNDKEATYSQYSEFKGQSNRNEHQDLIFKRQRWRKQYYELYATKAREGKKQEKEKDWVDEEYTNLQKMLRSRERGAEFSGSSNFWSRGYWEKIKQLLGR